MKKLVLVFSMTALLLLGGINMTIAQDQPVPKKDTVNMDTDAKPEFYYAIEDEESDSSGAKSGSSVTLFIIIGAVVIVGAAGFFLLKKKK